MDEESSPRTNALLEVGRRPPEETDRRTCAEASREGVFPGELGADFMVGRAALLPLPRLACRDNDLTSVSTCFDATGADSELARSEDLEARSGTLAAPAGESFKRLDCGRFVLAEDIGKRGWPAESFS